MKRGRVTAMSQATVRSPSLVTTSTSANEAGLPLVRPAWQRYALCDGVGQTMFFAERGTRCSEARALCRACPVSEECLDFALHMPAAEDIVGIWGGTSAPERRRLRAQRGIFVEPKADYREADLHARQRRIIELVIVGLSTNEIAVRMEVHAQTVRMDIAHARKVLGLQLELGRGRGARISYEDRRELLAALDLVRDEDAGLQSPHGLRSRPATGPLQGHDQTYRPAVGEHHHGSTATARRG